MQKNENLNLDDLVVSSGKEFDNTKEKLLESSEIDEVKPLQELMYQDAEIIPGGNAVMPTSDEVTMSKKDADDNLMKHIAMNKLAKENEEFNKLSDDEKVKNYVCDVQFYHETNEFYKKYGYEMSGKQKRYTKRAIEQAWKKGKLKVTPEQREDILYELSKASKQKAPTQINDTKSDNVSEHIKDLNSLIFRQL